MISTSMSELKSRGHASQHVRSISVDNHLSTHTIADPCLAMGMLKDTREKRSTSIARPPTCPFHCQFANVEDHRTVGATGSLMRTLHMETSVAEAGSARSTVRSKYRGTRAECEEARALLALDAAPHQAAYLRSSSQGRITARRVRPGSRSVWSRERLLLSSAILLRKR
jgi:hypothetical protein